MDVSHLSNLSILKERVDITRANKGSLNNQDVRLIYDFASRLASKDYFAGMIQGIVLFGSAARGNKDELGDVDLLCLVDDVSLPVDETVINAYNLAVGKLLVELKAQDRLHLTTLGITKFWDSVKNGDPLILTILRDGKAIVDTGFFKPLKSMLEKGMIRPSSESVYAHKKMAESLFKASSTRITSSMVDLYWAVVDMTHAVVMSEGYLPTYPSKSPELFSMVAKKHGLSVKYSKLIDDIVKLVKSIQNRKNKDFTGADYDVWSARVDEFLNVCKKIIDKHAVKKKKKA